MEKTTKQNNDNLVSGGGGAKKPCTLYYGDNLEILQKHIQNESIDMIYLDPPYNSKADYNMIFKTKSGDDLPAQILAFKDTWYWTSESESMYDKLMQTSMATVIKGLKETIGSNDMMAYLVMMAIRLIELYRVLKPTGSLYLHCDPTASHYIKIILDAIFDPKNFRNELIWYKGYRGTPRKTRFQQEHDTIFFYSKSDNYTWNDIRVDYKDKTMSRYNKTDKHGKKYALIKRRRTDGTVYYGKTYPKGKLQGDVIDIPTLASTSRERVKFQTQKPLALLEKLITASSNVGDTILDPFCGCGTSVVMAEQLHRNWVGIDITHVAVNEIEKRLSDSLNVKPIIVGVPKSFEDAKELASVNKFQFELWAISLIPKLHPNKRQVGDHGIDGKGIIKIDIFGQVKYETLIASVKGGKNLNPGMIRDLIGTMNGKAEFGLFICLEKPTKNMYKTAAQHGIYNVETKKFQKVQIFTIEDYFDNKKPDLPGIIDTMKSPSQSRNYDVGQTDLENFH